MSLWIHLYCNFIMLGLIVYVQLVHYPSFKYIEEKDFLEFCHFHQVRTTFIVLPIMFAELLTAFFLFDYFKSESLLSYLLILNILIWVMTFLVSVPLHMKLSSEKNYYLIEKLVKTNILRVVLWTMKSAILIYIKID